MAFISGSHAAVAVDTAERMTTLAAGTAFNHGFLYLDPAASGPVRFGDSTVKLATKIGAAISPGETVPIYGTSGSNPHHTGEIYLAFTGNAATDVVSWTVVKG